MTRLILLMRCAHVSCRGCQNGVSAMEERCGHLDQVNEGIEPSGDGCKECLEMGDQWMHLRLCMSCGHVGCCDNSKNRHATGHFHASQHPVIRSFEPGEGWFWCYPDDLFFELEDAPPPRHHP